MRPIKFIRELHKFKRYLIGFLVAPTAVLFWGVVFSLTFGWGSTQILLTPMLYLVVWIVQAIIGIPTIFVLWCFKILNVWTLSFSGAFVGLALSITSQLLQGYGMSDALSLERCATAGVFGASVAWLMWQIAFSTAPKDKNA